VPFVTSSDPILIAAPWRQTAASFGKISITSAEEVCSGSHPLWNWKMCRHYFSTRFLGCCW